MILFEGELIAEKDRAINKVGHGEWPTLLCAVNKIIVTIIIIIIVMLILIVLLNNFISFMLLYEIFKTLKFS